MQRTQKNWLKYIDFTELKNIASRNYSDGSNYSFLLFQVLQISLLFVLFKCATYFTFYFRVDFTKEN